MARRPNRKNNFIMPMVSDDEDIVEVTKEDYENQLYKIYQKVAAPIPHLQHEYSPKYKIRRKIEANRLYALKVSSPPSGIEQTHLLDVVLKALNPYKKGQKIVRNEEDLMTIKYKHNLSSYLDVYQSIMGVMKNSYS